MIATDVLTTIREEMILEREKRCPAAGMPGSLSSRLDSHHGGVWDIDPGSYKGHSVTDSMSQHLNQGRVTSNLLRKYVKML